jgi:hypothetical protein
MLADCNLSLVAASKACGTQWYQFKFREESKELNNEH